MRYGNQHGVHWERAVEETVCVKALAWCSLGAKGYLLKGPGKAALSLESSSASEKVRVKHEAHPQALRGI